MYNRFIALLKLDSNVNDSIYFNEIVKFFLKFLNFFKIKNFNSKKLFDDINSNNNLKKEKLADLYKYLLTTNLIDNKIFVYENFFKYSENPVAIEMKNIANNINNKNNLKNLNNKLIQENNNLLFNKSKLNDDIQNFENEIKDLNEKISNN